MHKCRGESMNNYPQSEYPNLYEEILKDYNFRYGKFNPIPYPSITQLQQHEQQRNQKITKTKY